MYIHINIYEDIFVYISFVFGNKEFNKKNAIHVTFMQNIKTEKVPYASF